MPRTFSAPAHPDCIMPRKPGVAVDRVVIHTMEGTFTGTLAWFQRGKKERPVPTAAHYLVSREGDICQMVPDAMKCYHAGNYNSRSIGIELEARIAPWASRPGKAPPFATDDFTDALLDSAAKVTAIMCRKFGIPADREHVVGHAEVPGATHTDPGSAFPWADFMARVVAHLAAMP